MKLSVDVEQQPLQTDEELLDGRRGCCSMEEDDLREEERWMQTLKLLQTSLTVFQDPRKTLSWDFSHTLEIGR